MEREQSHALLRDDQNNRSEYTEYQQDDDSYYEQEFTQSKNFNYGLYAVCAVIGIPLVYFFLVFLPDLAPPAAAIPDLVKVSSEQVYLHPIIPPKKAFISYVSEYTYKGKYKDDESPFKKVPDVKDWKLLEKSTKLFKRHFEKFGSHKKHLKLAKRLILIGDVHGSLTHLQKLLKQVKFDGGKHDQVFLLGDFIAKGNHELEILKRYTQFHALPTLSFVNHSEAVDEEFFHIEESYDLDDLMRIAKHLTPEHIQYISSCALIQELGPVPHLSNHKQTKYFEYPARGIAVHAGLLWNTTDLAEQDVDAVTTMRNLLPPDWTVPTDDRHDKVNGVKSEAWTKHWAAHQSRTVLEAMKSSNGSELTMGSKVYYGHDAKRGLTFKEFSTGLDSGCVYGAQLSAEIVWSEVVSNGEEGDKIVYKRMLSQVNC